MTFVEAAGEVDLRARVSETEALLNAIEDVVKTIGAGAPPRSQEGLINAGDAAHRL